MGSEVLLSRNGLKEQAKVIGCKRDQDGNVIDTPPEEMQYLVEFPDGDQQVHEYNALLDAIYIQTDEDGNEWYTFKDIIGHQKRPKGGRGKTKGWFLEIEWANGEITWETLTSIKDSNPFHAAKYAADNNLLEEPAFSYWEPHVLKKADRWIRAARTRKKNNQFKYGVVVPRNIEEAYKLDRENGNNLWRDAIALEMGTLKTMEVFNILDRGESIPADHTCIKIWMIFDVRMDFRRKARLVAGGHQTAPPTADTYSSVASRESVRLGFLLATTSQ